MQLFFLDKLYMPQPDWFLGYGVFAILGLQFLLVSSWCGIQRTSAVRARGWRGAVSTWGAAEGTLGWMGRCGEGEVVLLAMLAMVTVVLMAAVMVAVAVAIVVA